MPTMLFWSLLSTAPTKLLSAAPTTWMLLAQVEIEQEERGWTFEVAIIMLCLILGLMVTLRATKRVEEIKKPSQD